jgi:hypothetical protein
VKTPDDKISNYYQQLSKLKCLKKLEISFTAVSLKCPIIKCEDVLFILKGNELNQGIGKNLIELTLLNIYQSN